jgi:hypothetical protein
VVGGQLVFLKMILGYYCYKGYIPYPNELSVDLALRRINTPSFFFGFTDRWEESICLFHKWYGGEPQPFEMKNNRPTERQGLNLTMDYHDLDMEFIPRAMEIFDGRLAEAGCLRRASADIVALERVPLARPEPIT